MWACHVVACAPTTSAAAASTSSRCRSSTCCSCRSLLCVCLRTPGGSRRHSTVPATIPRPVRSHAAGGTGGDGKRPRLGYGHAGRASVLRRTSAIGSPSKKSESGASLGITGTQICHFPTTPHLLYGGRVRLKPSVCRFRNGANIHVLRVAICLYSTRWCHGRSYGCCRGFEAPERQAQNSSEYTKIGLHERRGEGRGGMIVSHEMLPALPLQYASRGSRWSSR